MPVKKFPLISWYHTILISYEIDTSSIKYSGKNPKESKTTIEQAFLEFMLAQACVLRLFSR